MPDHLIDMHRLRSAVALVTCLVATGAALSPSPAAAANAGLGRDACPTGVQVVVDPNELGGEPRTACIDDKGTASELFAAAGFPLEYQPNLQDFVCKVDGLPTDRSCTDGDSYWSLWWADKGGTWVYSTLGVSSLEVPAGGALGFAWHQGDGEAAPPGVDVGGAELTGTATTSGSSAAATDPHQVADEYQTNIDDSGSWPTWIGLGLAAVVLGAAGLVVLLRRRERGGPPA